MALRPSLDHLLLQAAYRYNRARFALTRAWLGDQVKFGHGCDVWAASLSFVGAGRVEFQERCSIERGPCPLVLDVAAGGVVRIGAGTWVRGKYRPNVLTCFEDARIEIGPNSIVNGAIVSARESIIIGRNALLSWDVAILDNNHHPLYNDQPIETEKIEIGDNVLLASGVTVLPGASIGSHTVIGARSVVTGAIPDHVVAVGSPARVVREIGDRDRAQ